MLIFLWWLFIPTHVQWHSYRPMVSVTASFGEVILSSVVIPPPEVTLSSAVLKLAQESVAINVQCLCKEHVPPVELHIKSRGTALTQSPEIFPLNFRKTPGEEFMYRLMYSDLQSTGTQLPAQGLSHCCHLGKSYCPLWSYHPQKLHCPQLSWNLPIGVWL